MNIEENATIEKVKELSPEVFKVKWFEFAGRNISFIFTYYHLTGNYPLLYPKFIGQRFTHTLVRAKGKQWMMYRVKSEINNLRKKLRKELLEKKKVAELLDKVENHYNECFEFCNNYKNDNSIDFLKKFNTKQRYAITAVSVVVEICSALSLQLEEKTKEAVIQLAVPFKPTIQFEQEKDLLEKLIHIKKNKMYKNKQLEMIKENYEKYAWAYFYMDESITPFEIFLEQNRETIDAPLEELQEKLEKKLKIPIESEKIVEKIIKKYSLDKELVKLFRRGIYLRIYGESLFGLTNKASAQHFINIAKKLGIALNQVRYLTIEEMEKALKKEINYEELIAERQKDYLLLMAGQNVFVLQGNQSAKLIETINVEKAPIDNSNEVKGVPAVKGVVKGVVKVITDVDELGKVQKGDVLVSKNTTPTFVPAMKKAVAVVTDEGGVTCHAAIVSREMGIPCIIGTGNGTRVLKDGDVVEVNANKGIVTKVS